MKNIDNFKKLLIDYFKETKKDLVSLNNILLANTLEEIYEEISKLPESVEKSYCLEKICEELIINYVSKAERSSMKLGLHRMEKILELFNNPHKKLNVIHIAGTNGKGSVSCYIKTALSENYKVGMYSSPAMISFNDRIRINDTFISYTEMYNLYLEVVSKWYKNVPNSDDNLSLFEILTVVGILYFAKENVDFVIMEVGLGGQYDGTNVFENKLLSIITKIGFDHTNILGNSLEKIAFEKAGIIQKNDNVIVYPANKEVLNVISSIAFEKDANFEVLNFEDIKIKNISFEKSIFSFKQFNDITIKMLGEHQIYNASLALLALLNLRERNIINLTNEQIKKSFSKTVWAGRLEWLRENILIDGAHNIDGVSSLVNYLSKQKFDKIKLLIGILEDKDYREMIKLFETLNAEFYITKVPINITSSSSLSNLANCFTKKVTQFENYEVALNNLLNNLEDDEILVVSGSLYLISEVRNFLLKGNSNE